MSSLALVFTILSVWASTPKAEAMQFSIEPDTVEARMARITIYGGQHRIHAAGPIESDTAQKLQSFVKVNKIKSAKIYFDSPGGSLAGGVALGEVIRDLGFDSAVGNPFAESDAERKGVCASSCAYAFAGGVSRFFDEWSGQLGVHQYYSDTNIGDLGLSQRVSGWIVSYLGRMGVDPALFTAAASTPGSEIRWLSPAEAVRLELANNGTEKTTAEIKLTGRNPYLRLEQNHHDVTVRLLVTCFQGQLGLQGGIVTTPELTSMKHSGLERTYFELDGKESLVLLGDLNTTAQESTLWLERTPKAAYFTQLAQASRVDLWTENGGPFRWGGHIDVKGVQTQIASFVRNCRDEF